MDQIVVLDDGKIDIVGGYEAVKRVNIGCS